MGSGNDSSTAGTGAATDGVSVGVGSTGVPVAIDPKTSKDGESVISGIIGSSG